MSVVNFSPLLGLALPTTGDLSGTWGTTVNDSITSLLDSAVAGTTTLSTDADVTLTTTNGVANQARNAVILWSATGTVTRNITAPAASKAYVVINATGGTQSIVIRGVGPTSGVTVAAAEKCLVAWNGSDFVKVSSTVPTAVGSFSIAGTSSSAAKILLAENTSNGTNTITLQAASSIATDFALTLPAADGTNGQFLSTNGSGQLTFQTAGSIITNTQTFTSSGTWTKPAGANWVQVVLWGGGGSGAANSGSACGGGGGMYFQQVFPASSLTSTVTVTIGAGGASVSATSIGNDGGNTTFGAYATAFGGKAGNTSSGGNGGGFSVGGGGTGTGGLGSGGIFDAGGAGFDRGGGAAGISLIGGGGGGSAGLYSSTNYAKAGGASSFGGNGGAGSYTTNGVAGTQPAGGGGGSYTNSGAGGAGQCIVYTW